MRTSMVVASLAIASLGCNHAQPEAYNGERTKAVATKAASETATKADPTKAEPTKADPTLPPTLGLVAESPWAADTAVTLVKKPGDRICVAAAGRDSDSVLWAQRMTHGDKAIGPATKLHVTSGEVVSIAAAFSGDLLWVAWRSNLGDTNKQITALAGFDGTLARAHKPRILRTIAQPPVVDDNLVVTGRGEDGRVAVAAFVGTRPCKARHPDEQGECRGLQIDLVAADGTSERSETRWLDGGDGAVDGLVDVGSGVVSSFHVWHGGPLTDVALIPADPTTPVVPLIACDYPPVEPLVVDTSIVMLCPDPDSGDGEGSSPDLGCKATAKNSTCGAMSRVDLTGAPVAPSSAKARSVPLRSVTKRCEGSKASVRLAWDGGHLDVPPDRFGVSCP